LVNYIAYSILLMNNSSLDVKIHDWSPANFRTLGCWVTKEI
jgi:hypothetical protein